MQEPNAVRNSTVVCVCVDIFYWSNGVRFVAALLAAAIAMTIAWYIAAIGIAASASV